MKIQVLFFASIRDLAGSGERTLDFSGGTVSDVLSQLQQQIPELVPHMSRMQIAVNEEYAERDRVLQEGDTLALIPPVSGGGR